MISAKTRSDIIRITIIWVVASAVVEAVTAYFADRYSGTASLQGEVTSEAIFFLLWITIPVFVLVVLVIFYSMVRFRVADDDTESSESQYRSGRVFPWGWVAMSVVLNVLFIIHPGLTGLAQIWSLARAATDPIQVSVTARQWGWVFAYPDQKLTNARDLVVPVDTPIRFELKSTDVIHSFWVPAWGIKKAVIPGETRTLVVTPNRLTETKAEPAARVQCSQICGVGHAEMRSVVRVVSRSDFDKWVETTRAAASEGGMHMPGMNMPGMEQHEMNMPGMKMPGMEMHETETEGKTMPGIEMPGTKEPGEAPADHDKSGMQMPGQAPMDQHMPGMKMPGMNMPAGDETNTQMPMDDQMKMNHTMPGGEQN